MRNEKLLIKLSSGVCLGKDAVYERKGHPEFTKDLCLVVGDSYNDDYSFRRQRFFVVPPQNDIRLTLFMKGCGLGKEESSGVYEGSLS